MEAKSFGVPGAVGREGQAGAPGQAMGNIFKSFMRFALLAAVATWGAGVQAVTNTFTASGNWVAPAGVTSIVVEAWGGGGAGGGATGNPAKGGGGAGGQYAKKVVTVVPGTTYAIVVGAGGAGGTGDGPAGGDSTFAATVVVARGGAGGTGAVNGIAGTGSSANGVGDLVYAGGSGSNGVVNGSCSNGGAGGGGAGSNGDGGDAFGNTAGTGTAVGGGNGGAGRNNSGNGNVGSVAGGGGGGACAESNTNRNGGNGAAGRVAVTYFTTPVVLSIARADSNPTGADSVSWVVVFNTSVTGVSSANFALANAGLTAPAITGVTEASGTGSNSTWTVTASTGTGAGTLGLNMTSTVGVTPAITNLPFIGQVYSVRQPVAATYFHDTTSGVAIGFDGPTNVVSGTNVTIPPIITASLITANTCTGSARSGSLTTTHPTGLYTHSRWYLTQDYIVATDISANPSGSARLRGGSATDTVTVSLYDYDPVSGAKVLIGSSAPITLTNFTATTTYPYTITSSVYTVPAGHRLMLQYDFDQTGLLAANYSARVYCDSTRAYITVTETPAPPPHHIQITHSGSALTCRPDVVTITACANAACTLPHYSGGVNVTLTPGGQTFAVDASGVNNAATVQQVTVGTATLNATSVPAAANAVTCWDTATATASCSLLFADSGLLVNVPDHVAEIAQSVTISAVRKANNALDCVPAFKNVSRTVELKCAYTNPSTGTLPVRMAGVALNAGNDPVATCDATGQSPMLAFDANGTVTTTLQYADVGQMTVSATYTGSAGTGDAGLVMTGSGSFIAAPASFAFSAITAAPIKAGANFGATVTALNGAATPAATPNFGKETTPEGVTLTFSKCQPTGTNAVNGTFSGSGTFTNGVASATDLNWSEVGNGDLVATLTSGSYLGSGLSATGNTGTGGTVCNGAGNVGRFIPDHFDTVVTGPMSCPAGLVCPTGGLVYSGQAFTANVYARNAAGATTQNYDGTVDTSPNFAKAVTLTAWDASGSTTTENPPAVTPGAITGGSNAVASSAFNRGSTLLGTPGAPVYTFGTSPTAPTDVYIRAKDTDNATSLRVPANTSVEDGVKVVSGRIKLANAYGSELLALPITATAQYFNATGSWVTSITDSATQFDTRLSTAGGNVQATIVNGPLALGNISVVAPGTVTLVNGVRIFRLAAPTVAGSTDLEIVTAPAYLLPGAVGRATFGVYRGPSEIIYMREAY